MWKDMKRRTKAAIVVIGSGLCFVGVVFPAMMGAWPSFEPYALLLGLSAIVILLGWGWQI